MGNRFTKWTAVLGAVALLSGALVVTANAHIGSSHSQVSTDGPDLVSATGTSDDTADFCFDVEITDVTDVTGFHLWGYDSEYLYTSTDAEESGSDENCVEVTFDPDDADNDVRETTVAQVDDDSVEDRSGEENVLGTVDLGGSILSGGSGITTAPNLVSVDPDSDGATFTFDQLLDCSELDDGTTDAENFGFYDDDGLIFYGDDINDCNDDEVDVEFADDGDVEDDAERFFHAPTQNDDAADDTQPLEGAIAPSGDVCQGDSDGADGACAGYEAEGEEIEDRPDLTDADRTDEDGWTYAFDEDVDDGAITDEYFHIYAEDGTEATADAADCSEDDDSTVECSFDETDFATAAIDIEEAQDTEIPLAAVEHCAVEEVDSTPATHLCGTYGDAATGDSDIRSGATDAPDLETLELRPADEQANFCFDENVDDTDANVDDDEFFLLEADGDRTSAGAGDVDDVEDNCVLVDFDEEDLNSAVAGGVDEAAVQDWLANDSVPATVGTEVTSTESGRTTTTTATGTQTATSTVTGTQTATQTVTTTQPTSPTRRDRKVATTLTIRYDRNANAFRGSAAARARRCQAGRLVTLKKHRPGPNRSVGTDTTNKSGNWKIRKRVRRGRFYAVVAKKTFTNRTGGTTTCQRDKSVTIKLGRRR